jgi:hypothetical protein
MRTKTLFILAAFFTLVLGLAWMFFPEALLNAWGIASSSALIYMARRCAVLFLGTAVILWSARTAPQSPALHAIIAGSFTSTALMALMSLYGVVSTAINPSGLIAFGLEASLTMCFGYSLFANRGWNRTVANTTDI